MSLCQKTKQKTSFYGQISLHDRVEMQEVKIIKIECQLKNENLEMQKLLKNVEYLGKKGEKKQDNRSCGGGCDGKLE